MTETQLDSGTYQVLRNRLQEAADDLRRRLDKLNIARADVFGSIETKLIATERVSTDHNCIPRDLVAIDDQFIFGYNVQFGLKTEIELADVFSVYRFESNQFHHASLDLLGEGRFREDFSELYRFYKDTTFSRFFRDGPMLHMVFRVGKTHRDVKSFKWRIDGGQLRYVDNRSEHEVKLPPQHEFQWTRTNRDQHHYGEHPHISIEDRVFVETVGGDLTVKVENNTASGEGIYAEPVDHADQTLDDAEIYYACLGNLVLLKIRPYQESRFRYIVFNGKINKATRLDEIEHACVMLPSDQGIIFPGGYYLQTGEFKRFDHGLEGMRYQRTVASSNGEDFLYLFYNTDTGLYVQLRYNMIRQCVETPLICHGQTLFERGEMVCFTAHTEPQKHHPIQVWQTSFTGPDYVPENQTGSLLFKIGNKEIVGGMAECSELLQLVEKDDSYDGLYIDLAKKSGDVLDSYFWIHKSEAEVLGEPLGVIRETANAAIEEFEKVLRIRRDTADKSNQAQAAIDELVKEMDRARFDSIDDYVLFLKRLREQRGHAIGLRDLRYIDPTQVDQMETTTAEHTDRLSRRCVDFLLSPNSLLPYQRRVEESAEEVNAIRTVAEANTLEERIGDTSSQLELLTETVSNLRIEDTTKRTEIVDAIGDVFASLNRVRSGLRSRVSDLVSVEGKAEFASQLKLLEQTTSGYLDVCDSPEKCDDYLTKIMVQLEELEGRFAEFDQFIDQLATRREEVYAAFESRKIQLVEKRNRRAETLASAAERVLKGIASRVRSMKSIDEISAYFAGDLMAEKVRDVIGQLSELDDSVRAEDLLGRMKTVREDAIRQLKDRQDLYEQGGEVIRLGKQKFAVNTQPLDLTTVLREGEMCLHLTGTQFFEQLSDSDLVGARDLWNQETVSESESVYRGEFLAFDLFDFLGRSARAKPAAVDLAWVQEQMSGRYDEGYAKGVHDQDALAILNTLLRIDHQAELLRHSPSIRAAGLLWFQRLITVKDRKILTDWITGFSKLLQAFPEAQPAVEFRSRLSEMVAADSGTWQSLFPLEVTPERIAAYLFDQLIATPRKPVVSKTAAELFVSFNHAVTETDRAKLLIPGLKSNLADPARAFVLARNWTDAFLATLEPPQQEPREPQQVSVDHPEVDPVTPGDGTDSAGDPSAAESATFYRDELAMLVLAGDLDGHRRIDVNVGASVTGLGGSHRRIRKGTMPVHYHEFTGRLRRYREQVVPRFKALHEAKSRIVDTAREEMRLDEFKPRVLTSFVRNRLLDEVYLPLIGDNLAKQMGAAGEGKRTDRMGLLLLISPPGYGKTTLMEYVANRLGIVFMKINGPAIGHGVTSLDPAEAPNAAAREEVERLNLALEMGDNVMLYLDDIQHTHPELLQKFISLCDATRKIEGVRHGKTRTYDLRGRRVAVVMAGNPYTESGDRFQIPDMLSNRADVYNLGEIIGDSDDAFEMSYLENCLTSNAVLAPLATASPEDSRAIIRAAERESFESLELEGNWAIDQVREMYDVITKLLKVRDVVLKVNRAYIRSAAQADAYRTEPPFKLQGSYRNMNRMAERVAGVMNDSELQSLIISNYEQDAQTLTTDNEANVLKFKELMGILDSEETERWEAIKYAFVESTRMQGMESDDQSAQFMRQLASMRDGLESIRQVISRAIAARDNQTEERMDDRIASLRKTLAGSASQLVETLAATSTQLEAISRQQAQNPPDQKILVQHKVPRVLADLVKGQFHLIQEWLRPILDESIDSRRDLSQLQASLEEMMRSYSEVEDSFAEARKSAKRDSAPPNQK